MNIEGKIILERGKEYAIPIKNGYLDIAVSYDPEYPGIDIEYVSDAEDKLPKDEMYTRPRVVVEEYEGTLHALAWADTKDEDYSDEVTFACAEDVNNPDP